MLLGDLVERDLEALDTQPVYVTPTWPDVPDGMAMDYVLFGSRLGTQVLRRRWAVGSDPVVKAADAYFSAPSFISAWQQFCRDAERLPAQSELADQVVADANHLFDFYASCASEAQSKTETMNA